jgi:hypothetical protein
MLFTRIFRSFRSFRPASRERPDRRLGSRVRACSSISPEVRVRGVENDRAALAHQIVLERPISSYDSPPCEADDQNPVSLRYEFGGSGYEVSSVFGSLLKQIGQSRLPAVRAGQRPTLARNDPFDPNRAKSQAKLYACPLRTSSNVATFIKRKAFYRRPIVRRILH